MSGLGEGMLLVWSWGGGTIPYGFPFPMPLDCCCHGGNMASAQKSNEYRLVERYSEAPLPTLELGPEVGKTVL